MLNIPLFYVILPQFKLKMWNYVYLHIFKGNITHNFWRIFQHSSMYCYHIFYRAIFNIENLLIKLHHLTYTIFVFKINDKFNLKKSNETFLMCYGTFSIFNGGTFSNRKMKIKTDTFNTNKFLFFNQITFIQNECFNLTLNKRKKMNFVSNIFWNNENWLYWFFCIILETNLSS